MQQWLFGPQDKIPVPDLATLKNRAGVSGAAEAEQLVQRERYQEAATLYRTVAQRCKARGDQQSAIVYDIQSKRFETRTRLFSHQPANEERLRQKYFTNRRLEPIYGAYIGAFIDREDKVKETFVGFNGQRHRDGRAFNQQIGRNHASFLTYARYGNPFPEAWFSHLKEIGAAAQLAWEPDSLNEVQDDSYLREFAKAVGATQVPVFLRFASEMNGKWTPYNGNPAAYRRAFQTVAKVFHQEAPLVALVWCPNETPMDKIADYYPGEDATDWVGLNFYNVLFNNNDPRRPVTWRHPADCLDFIYQIYSARHPIMIGEWAATHRSSAEQQERPEFARDKIGQLYSSLPRLYPRIKAVHWFSMNAIRWAPPSRQINDYSLLGNTVVAQRYKELVSSRYFLEQVRPAGELRAPEEILPLSEGQALVGSQMLSVWAKTYTNRPKVRVLCQDKEVAQFLQPGHLTFTLDTKVYTKGPTSLITEVYDEKGKLASRQALKVVLGN